MTSASNIINLQGGSFTDHSISGFRISASHFYHNFTVAFFDAKIRKNFWKKFVERFSSEISFINLPAISKVFVSILNFFPKVNPEKLFEPLHDTYINGGKLKNRSVMQSFYSFFSFNSVDVKTSVSINITSQISKFSFLHIFSIVKGSGRVYDKTGIFVHGERLSPWDIRNNVCDSLNSYESMRGRSEEVSPPKKLGHKSNRMPVLNSAAARLGQALRETQDALQRDNLESSASIINCVGGTNGDLPTEMAITDVDDVVTTLQNNSGEYITNMIGGEDRFGTSPIGDSYICMLTTRMIPIMNNMTGFIRKFQYPNIKDTLSTEWGGANNVRFFVSEQGSVTPNASLLGNDIANCFVAAKEAYKVVWQAGGKARFIYMPPGFNNDPCMLRHTAGCSFYQGQCITNDLWLQNLRSTGI